MYEVHLEVVDHEGDAMRGETTLISYNWDMV